MNFELVSDSSCDLSSTLIAEYGINIVPFYVSFNGETYYKENVDITVAEFYDRLIKEDVYPKTSLPAVQDYCDVFESILQQGKDVVCVCLSSKFSGSYQSACNAKLNLADQYPDRRIEIIDSLAATVAQGEIVKFVAKLRIENATIDDVLNKLNNVNLNYKVFFTVDSLEYLAKGGRLGKGSLLLGTLLDIKPILNHSDGELFPVAKVRKKQKAFDYIVNEAYEYSKLFKEFNVTVASSVDSDDFKQVVKMCQKKFGKDVLINTGRVGCTIGVHTGPTAIGVLISNYN